MTAIIEPPVVSDDADEFADNEFPDGDDLAFSRATDFYELDELLTDRERELRDRVRVWCDTDVAPAAAGYWERAEFPVELAKRLRAAWESPARRSWAMAARGCRSWPRA